MKESHKLRVHTNTAPSQHPQPSLPWPSPYEREWQHLNHCSFLPLPAKLSEGSLR